MTTTSLSRRSFLRRASAAVLATNAGVGLARRSVAAEPVNFATWSAAVDTVKSHVAAFEAKTGIKVAYSNLPWAQYRESMITKFVGGAPVDTLWVSDSWLPEWAEAGWLVPIDQYKQLTAYNGDVDDFCNESMAYKGRQYGLTYYTDYMGFLYNSQMLEKAGIAAPPASWAEVAEQAKAIKAKGLSQFPVMMALAQETWLIEFLSALVFSHGGSFTDQAGNAVMQDPAGGATAALRWLTAAVQKDKILSPSCVETGELAGLKTFSSGQHAFGLIPKYRLRTLNDPTQSQIAGHAKLESTVKLIEWFGGKADGEYGFQKLLFKDVGAGFGIKSLFQDPEMRAAYAAYGDVDLIGKQQSLARKKDVIAPWFGEWNDVNGTAWQEAILGKASAEQALKTSAAKWSELKKQA